MPKVSVIVAVYNAEKYIKECLDSLINQTLKDIEILCVNDGSTDKSWDILKEYAEKDSRIKIFNQKNKGPGGARNTALEAATGEFICITDSDDYRSLDCLEKLYNSAKENNTDAAFCDYIIINEDGSFRNKKVDPRPYNEVFDIKTNFANSLFQCQSIFKRELIKDYRYLENVDYEDGMFVCEIYITLQNTIHVKDVYYYYRSGKPSSSSGYTYRIFKIPKIIKYFSSLLVKHAENKNINYLKSAYKYYIRFLLKKAFFKRMPPDASYFRIIKLYMEMFKYMNNRQKKEYGAKILVSILKHKKFID